MLSAEEIRRYAPQIKLERISFHGQAKLKQARVLCIGAGGLGSSLLMYLAAAGVGHLGIVDGDQIEESNLHRQLLYQTSQIGQNKAIVAQQRLQASNPLIKVDAHAFHLTSENALSLIEKYELIADCTDNFTTRYLIHENCFQAEKPYIYASAAQFHGHCALFYGKQNPCLACLFPLIPEPASCQAGGVLNTLPGILGLLQATEIIKWLINQGNPLLGRLLIIDLLNMQFKEIKLVKNETCPLCAGM